MLIKNRKFRKRTVVVLFNFEKDLSKMIRIYLIIFSIIICGPFCACANDELAVDDDDPFKTTDPKKREPSPCESKHTRLAIGYSSIAKHNLIILV